MRSSSPIFHRTRLALMGSITAPCLVAAFGTAPAPAQSADVQAAMRDPAVKAAVNICRADRDRLCAWVMPGGGRIVRCLAAKPDQLSPDCRAAMEQARGALIAAGVVTVDAAVTPPPAGQ